MSEKFIWHKWMGDQKVIDDEGRQVFLWETKREIQPLLLCQKDNTKYVNINVTTINQDVTCQECLEWLHA